MSQEDITRLREAYAAYNREGIIGILPYLDPEVEWRNPVDSPIAGLFIGHGGLLEWPRQVDEVFEDMNFEVERIDELPGGRFLAGLRFRFRVRIGDSSAEVPLAHLIRWSDGRASALGMDPSEAEALKAVGLEE